MKSTATSGSLLFNLCVLAVDEPQEFKIALSGFVWSAFYMIPNPIQNFANSAVNFKINFQKMTKKALAVASFQN